MLIQPHRILQTMCKTALNPPPPMMLAAPEISEQHTSNLYGLLNIEASEEAAISGGSGGAHSYDPCLSTGPTI